MDARLHDACNGHDRCYGTCGDTKSACDKAFIEDLLAKSGRTTAWLRPLPVPRDEEAKQKTCISLAKAYHEAVSSKGTTFYSDAQKKGCEWNGTDLSTI